MQLARRGARHKWWKCSYIREKELWQAASRRQKTKYRVARLARTNTRATARAVDPPPGNLFTHPPVDRLSRADSPQEMLRKTQHLPSTAILPFQGGAIDCPIFQIFLGGRSPAPPRRRRIRKPTKKPIQSSNRSNT